MLLIIITCVWLSMSYASETTGTCKVLKIVLPKVYAVEIRIVYVISLLLFLWFQNVKEF